MNILLMGPQGSGKGTQARNICEKFNFFYFESGAYLRRIAETDPWLKKWLTTGKLVPDKELTSYLSAFLDKNNLYDNVVFDGFPRTLVQYQFWKDWLKDKDVALDLVIVLKISKEETVKRLTSRRQDPNTGEIYNLVTDPPPPGVDVGTLVQRDDDKPKAVEERLADYHNITEPLIAELKKDTKVIEIDGERPIEVISGELIKIIEENGK